MTRHEFVTEVQNASIPLGGTGLVGLSVPEMGEPGVHLYSGIRLREGNEQRLYGPWLNSIVRPMFENCPCIQVFTPKTVSYNAKRDGTEGYALEVSLKEREQGLAETNVENVRTAFEEFAGLIRQMRDAPKDLQDLHATYNREHESEIREYAARRRAERNGEQSAKETNNQPTGGNTMDVKQLLKFRNLIFFGAPGTGKSHQTDEIVRKYADTIRTTFHPDSDYASFAGCYKPAMDGKSIVYSFVPQAFTKAYVQAWEKMVRAQNGEDPEKQFLVIEEINRGNCAQIFGDLFQLLDRADNNYSKYPIDPDADLAKHLNKWFCGEYKDGDGKSSPNVNELFVDEEKSRKIGSDELNATWGDVLEGRKLVLPPNLYIWATMNTSDQSLFPMDSAFKRRWEWRYSKISEPKKDADGNEWKKWTIKVGSGYDWWEFLQKINAVIRDVTKSADKQLGYFFVKLPEGETVIDAETFVNKVVFYLWNDVFRDCELDGDAFKIKIADEMRQLAYDDFFKDDGTIEENIVKGFLSKLLKSNENNADGNSQTTGGNTQTGTQGSEGDNTGSGNRQ